MQYDVSPGYFSAAGTTLLAGRTFTWHDDKNAPRVAVVNREFARQVFGSTKTRWADITKSETGRGSRWSAWLKTESTGPLPRIRSLQCFFRSSNRRRAHMAGGAVERRSAGTDGGGIGRHCEPGCRTAVHHQDLVQDELDSSCFLRAWRQFRWECWGRLARCFRSQGFLGWLRTR